LGIGQSSCIGIGGDPIIGFDFIDVLRLFQTDSKTDQVVLIGEIGAVMEQYAADYQSTQEFSKPICALIVGATAPSGKKMGHAEAIRIPNPAEIGETVRKLIESSHARYQNLSIHFPRTGQTTIQRISPCHCTYTCN
jgi:succinyl-CoA synthetase alpha subunit